MISDDSSVIEDVRKVTPFVANTKEGREGKYKILVAWDPATNRDVGWLTLAADSSKVGEIRDVGKLQFRNWNLASTKKKTLDQGVGMGESTPPSKAKFHPVTGNKVFLAPENTNVNKSFSKKPAKISAENKDIVFVPLASSSPMAPPPVKPRQVVQSPNSECDVSKDGRDKVSCEICQRIIGKKGLSRHMKTHLKQKISLNNTNVSMNSVNISTTHDKKKKNYFFPEQKTRPKETPSAKSDLFKMDSVKTKKAHINPKLKTRPEDTVSKKGNIIHGLNEKPEKECASKTFCKHSFHHHEKGKRLTIQTPTTTKILKAMKKFDKDYIQLEFLTAKKRLLTGDELAGDVPRGEISVRRRRFVEAEDVNDNPYIGDGDKAAVKDKMGKEIAMGPLELSNSWDSQVGHGQVKRRKVESGIDSMVGSYDPINDSDSEVEEN